MKPRTWKRSEIEAEVAELRALDPPEGSEQYRRLQLLEDLLDLAPNAQLPD